MIRPLLLSLSLLAMPLRAANGVDIVGAEFGLFDEGRGGEVVFQPSAVVPKAVGQRYGWIIEVRTLKRSLAVREEYVLPPSPKQKDPDSPVARNLHIPDLRRSQVSQRQLAPVDGQIVGEWSIGPGDPVGKRRLQVIVEGEVAASFDFEVQ